MTWVRIDDGFADHPKILAAGPLAIVAQIRALCYCARHLTDGHLPEPAAAQLLADLSPLTADVLIEAKLWHRNGRGYVVHDYLRYNPTRHAVMKLRANRKKAGQAGGQASASARAGGGASTELNPPTPTRPVPQETNPQTFSTIDQQKSELQKKKAAALEVLRRAGLNPPEEDSAQT